MRVAQGAWEHAGIPFLRRRNGKTLLVDAAHEEGVGFAFPGWLAEPRAALAEARLPWATIGRPFGAEELLGREEAVKREQIFFR